MGTGSSGGTYLEIEGLMEAAINVGCRFFDTARAYGRGTRETELGKFLTPKYRKEIILLSKSGAKNADELNRDLEASLKELNTNYLDVYLLHNITSTEDVDSRLQNGVLDAMVKAKEQGMIKHIGFSGHFDPDANIYFLDRNLPEIEVTMFPVNPVDPLRKSFVLNVLPKVVEKPAPTFRPAMGRSGQTPTSVRDSRCCGRSASTTRAAYWTSARAWRSTSPIGCAVVAFCVLLLVALRLMKAPVTQRGGVMLLVLLFVQVTLGVLNIVLQLPLPNAVAHNAVAALLLLQLLWQHHRATPSRG